MGIPIGATRHAGSLNNKPTSFWRRATAGTRTLPGVGLAFTATAVAGGTSSSPNANNDVTITSDRP
jgi:hypothetical protein